MMKSKPPAIPVNWPFRTYNGVVVPQPRPVRTPKPVYPDAPF